MSPKLSLSSETMSKPIILIATNSYKMLVNFRQRLFTDILRSYNVNLILYSDETVSTISNLNVIYGGSHSKLFGDFIRDLHRAVKILRTSPCETIIFTSRCILLYGVASLFCNKKLTIAYFAGIGNGIPSFFFLNTIGRFLLRTILSQYSFLVVLNTRDREVFSSFHDSIIQFNGEGFDFSVAQLSESESPTLSLPKYKYGFVGRPLEDKGFFQYLKLAKVNSHLSFCFFGDPIDFSSMQIPTNLSIYPFSYTKSAIYGSFETLIVFSRHNEGLPFVLLEAAYYQRSVFILSNSSTDKFARNIGLTPFSSTCFESASNKINIVESYKRIPCLPVDIRRLLQYESNNEILLRLLRFSYISIS
jgi:hypothetical protein